MANEKVESKAGHEKAPEVKKPEPKPVSAEPKVKFLVWFTAALSRFDGLKAHHMTAVRSYFQGFGLPDPEKSSAYDEALKKYGLLKKKKK